MPFIHTYDRTITTLSELLKLHNAVVPDKFFGCYAYATQSGFRSFDLAFEGKFWQKTSSRWLFGIDYGRTDPRALRTIVRQENTEVRIFDGEWVVAQEGFWPRRDFHAKVALMQNTDAITSGMVLGSGNFSDNGLCKSVEAGAALFTNSQRKFDSLIYPVQSAFESYWSESTPVSDIIDDYEGIVTAKKKDSDVKRPRIDTRGKMSFWIEAGYVTKNRGPEAPGNQIFFPKGFRMFFGFPQNAKVEKNAIIGTVHFVTSVGTAVTNNLRLNRNGMEKISLPTPEAHGFGVYDGKVLVFEPDNGAFFMKAFEQYEFNSLYGDRLVNVEAMSGGRRYGAIMS